MSGGWGGWGVNDQNSPFYDWAAQHDSDRGAESQSSSGSHDSVESREEEKSIHVTVYPCRSCDRVYREERTKCSCGGDIGSSYNTWVCPSRLSD